MLRSRLSKLFCKLSWLNRRRYVAEAELYRKPDLML